MTTHFTEAHLYGFNLYTYTTGWKYRFISEFVYFA